LKSLFIKNEYFFWRALYITIKPLSLYLASRLIGNDFSNLLALAILCSGIFMASLSMGSYRKIFTSKESKVKTEYYQVLRRSIFVFNVLILTAISLVISFFSNIGITLFILLFVINEHLIHDEVRLLLYRGERTSWARQNCIRTFFIPLLPTLMFYFDNDKVLPLLIMCLLLAFNAFYSYKTKGLLSTSSAVYKHLMKRKFYSKYAIQLNYFFSATINRIIQQSDKFLFSIINFELFWIYTLLCQVINIPLLMFEVVFVSELKAKIAQIRKHSFTWLNRKQLVVITCVTAMAVVLYIFMGLVIPELLQIEFIGIALFICLANYFSATSMMNSEKLFWHLGNAKKYRELEFSALIMGHILLAPIIIYFGWFLAAKVPNVISILFKLRNSKKWLSN
jgi:hypothetical protein